METIIKILKSMIEPTMVLLVLIVLLVLNAWIFKRSKSTASNGNITKGAIAFFDNSCWNPGVCSGTAH